ncbi:MAG TPA: VCBS repeat-containing protein, partial [Opitutus sp.]|nr:VCBS repeat-containing protein [Opitutus sp.]
MTSFAAGEPMRGLPFTRAYPLSEIRYVSRGPRLNFDSFGRLALIKEGVYAVLNDTVWINLAAPIDDSTAMVNVVQGPDGRAYYGERGVWGVAERGADGKLRPLSLVEPSPPAWTTTAYFDDIITTPDGVYFGSWNGVVFWSPLERRAKFFELAKGSRIFRVGSKVYYSAKDQPLHQVDIASGSLRAVPETERSGMVVELGTPLDGERSLLSFSDGKLMVFDGRSLVQWPAQISNDLHGRISALQQLADGAVAVAINGKGLFLIGANGRMLSSLTTNQYHVVTGLASREPGVLWVALEDAVEKILYGGPLTVFGGRLGLPVEWPVLQRWGEKLIVLSDRKLYEALPGREGATGRFRLMANQPPGGAFAIGGKGAELLVGSQSENYAAVEQMPHSAMGSDLGDVDNDGWMDLLVSDMAATTREKDQRGVAKIRALLDTTPEDSSAPLQFMRSTLLLGTGTSWLRESALYSGVAATDWTWSVRFEDFDNDGRLDLHVTNGMVRELHNADLVQDISATESRAAALRLERAAPVFAERNLAYRNQGEGRFSEVGREWGLDELGVSLGTATGDFDGDGDLDLIYGNYESGPTVLRNDSVSGHRVVVALRGTRSNRFGVGAVVRLQSASRKQMRTLVLARGYLSTSEPILHFGLGEDPVIEKLTVEWPSGHVQQFTNVPADQKLTITEPVGSPTVLSPAASTEALFEAEPTELIMRERAEPETNRQPLIPFRFDRRGPALAVLPDETGGGLLLGGTTQDPLRGFMADPLDDGPLLVFEANGDGRPDLLQTKAGISRAFGADYQPRLHLATASGYASAALPSIPQSTGAVCAADYDRDGDIDVFLGARVLPGKYPLSPRSFLLRNDGGTFKEVPLPRDGELGMVTSAVWSDLDQDGWTDLVVTTEWGTVLFLRNDQGTGFSDRSAEQGFTELGFWTSLVSADFNRDGKPDYAVGNVGLNTPYQAGPAILFHGRFGDGGPPVIIEAVQESDQLYPRRSRNELGLRITGLLRRFP